MHCIMLLAALGSDAPKALSASHARLATPQVKP